MVKKIAPEKPTSTKVQHGEPSKNPIYPTMSLEELKKLGLDTGPVLIFAGAENFKRLARCVSKR
jgi:hypothetical protein